MSLTVVSIPIGDPGDITLRAIETLKTCEVLICEELKPARVLLKQLGISLNNNVDVSQAGMSTQGPLLVQLNEHSKPSDLEELVGLCRSKKVALISDCGTPGFHDPGPELVSACMGAGIAVVANPGASSLMTLISLCGLRLNEFYFVGFLSAEREKREQQVNRLKQHRVPIVILDTPYRLSSTIQALAGALPSHKAILGIDLTSPQQQVLRASLKELATQALPKAPFVLLITPP